MADSALFRPRAQGTTATTTTTTTKATTATTATTTTAKTSKKNLFFFWFLQSRSRRPDELETGTT